jgi:hypothetical protein
LTGRNKIPAERSRPVGKRQITAQLAEIRSWSPRAARKSAAGHRVSSGI